MTESIRVLPARTVRHRPLHEYSRSGHVGGVAWAYCRTHRRWEAA